MMSAFMVLGVAGVSLPRLSREADCPQGYSLQDMGCELNQKAIAMPAPPSSPHCQQSSATAPVLCTCMQEGAQLLRRHCYGPCMPGYSLVQRGGGVVKCEQPDVVEAMCGIGERLEDEKCIT